ncbi:hypothetical protein PI124_g14131 [Phytophthora idaei]|nr:hypothetical protein PI124_g14131 [Phytophthora idaei]
MIALLPNQPVQLRLYLGVQPGNKNCPPGMYRPIGAGIAVGECEFCPRGLTHTGNIDQFYTACIIKYESAEQVNASFAGRGKTAQC